MSEYYREGYRGAQAAGIESLRKALWALDGGDDERFREDHGQVGVYPSRVGAAQHHVRHALARIEGFEPSPAITAIVEYLCELHDADDPKAIELVNLLDAETDPAHPLNRKPEEAA